MTNRCIDCSLVQRVGDDGIPRAADLCYQADSANINMIQLSVDHLAEVETSITEIDLEISKNHELSYLDIFSPKNPYTPFGQSSSIFNLAMQVHHFNMIGFYLVPRNSTVSEPEERRRLKTTGL